MDIDTIHQASQNRFPCPHMKNTLFLVELAAYIYRCKNDQNEKEGSRKEQWVLDY